MNDDSKKVGHQLTLSVPAKISEFREHVDRGLRRNGFLTSRERAAGGSPRKGCQKLSRATRIGLQGPRNELHEHLPREAEELSPGALEYLSAKWGQQQAELRSQRVELSDAHRPDPDPIWHQAPVVTREPLDRRGVWEPPTPAPERPLRRAMYILRDAIRPISQPRCQACGRAIVSADGSVGVEITADGRCKLKGLAHCGSVWECAVCQMVILQARAEQVRQAVERHGSDRVGMITLTIRHGAGDNLRELQRKLSRAFAAVSRSRAYRGGEVRDGYRAGWKQRHGVHGRIRAVEVTHGPNGWHPHLHVLFFFDERLPVEVTATKDGRRVRWTPSDEDRALWIREWQKQVKRILGAPHVPDDRHAVVFSLASDGEYIAKLGLELVDPANKRARKPGHRTPWQIAQDFAEALNAVRAIDRDGSPDCDDMIDRRRARVLTERDAQLWRTYCADMRGCHRVVWSNGLKRAFGVADTSDPDVIADDDETKTGDTWIATIPHYVWQAIRDERIRGVPAPYVLLRIAEAEGAQAFERALLRIAAGEH